MSISKSKLAQALTAQSPKAQAKLAMPIAPLDLDAQTVQPHGLNTVDDTQRPKPRRQVKATLNARKRGKVQTERFAFEITPELKTKLIKRRAQLELETGKRVSNSQIIRDALARELREI